MGRAIPKPSVKGEGPVVDAHDGPEGKLPGCQSKRLHLQSAVAAHACREPPHPLCHKAWRRSGNERAPSNPGQPRRRVLNVVMGSHAR